MTYRLDVSIECEWGNPKAVAFDFEKLLYVKSLLKVMICNPQTAAGKDMDPLPEILAKIRRYPDHVAGEHYLVVDVRGHRSGGEARAYCWEVENSGAHPEATLKELPESPFTYRFRSDQASAATQS